MKEWINQKVLKVRNSVIKKLGGYTEPEYITAKCAPDVEKLVVVERQEEKLQECILSVDVHDYREGTEEDVRYNLANRFLHDKTFINSLVLTKIRNGLGRTTYSTRIYFKSR